MNILFVVPYVPNRLRSRSYNLIRRLSLRGHRVSVLTIWTDAAEAAQARDLAQHCHQVRGVHLPRWQSLGNSLLAWPAAVPMQAMFSWTPRLLAQASLADDAIDVVHVEHLRGARYALHYKSAGAQAGRRIPVVWDSVDCISYLFQQAMHDSRSRFGRLVSRLEFARTRRYEQYLLPKFDRVLISSAKDREIMVGLARGGREPGPGAEASPASAEHVLLLANGVDVDYFAPTGEPREPDTLVFSGKMSYHANVTAVLHLINDIMPLIWQQRPEVRLRIAGKDPAPELVQLAAQHAPRVALTDTTAEAGGIPDLRPALRRSAVAVVPLVYGAGSQFKVLEAMACGTPVVASPPAVAPLSARPGRDVVVGESAPAFAEAVVRLLADPDCQKQIGAAGRTYVEAEHRWDKLAERLEGIYQQVAPQPAG
jgi:glycosyltransferase involved in cell wall biosynthesis